MSTDLQHLTHSELISRLTARELQVEKLQQSLANKDRLIAQFQRMIFGQSRERFAGDPDQGRLPFDADPIVEKAREESHEQAREGVRKKTSRPNHNGRLPLPDNLPVEEVHIYPDGDLSDMTCIGQEVTDELELQPARLYIKRYIRYKYAATDHPAEGVRIGALPERVIGKGIAGPGLLATILVDKYADHLPLYRQRQRFAREGVTIAQSTLDGWAAQAMDLLEILWDQLAADTKSRGYIQVDESRIKVLESLKKGACHQGWYWVYHSPIEKTVLFDYQPTRGAPAPKRLLDDFTGYLQTDGYGVYDKIAQREGVVHLACWAHARREFERALDNDRGRAEQALSWIQDLYAVERQAREEDLSPGERKKLRLEASLPIINQLGAWIHAEAKQVLPKSQIGKAMAYSAKRWDALSGYLHDGLLEIDNNLVENTIRPLALGRKNYLFAGSHAGARRAAMVYSLLGTCKLHGVNPTQWLTHVLANILQTKYNDVRSLYPQNFNQP
jgi:transposase